MGLNMANGGQMEENVPKIGPNGDKRSNIGQNLFKDGDCPRDGDYPRNGDHYRDS